MRKVYLFLLLVMFSNSYAYATDKVSNIDDYYTNYKGLHDVMMHSVMNDSSLSTSQKMMEYTKRLTELKQKFRSERLNEYTRVVISLSKGNSCTKGYSGGSKRCDKYIDAPENFYTKPDWTGKYKENGTPMNKQAEVSGNGKRVWTRIKKSGQGKYYEEIRADFRYEPLFVERTLNNEVTMLFNRILSI